MSSAAVVASVGERASNFACLLRRSRFATFDPAVRQTYASPPEHAHRGDWGLKRPLPLRRKNGFITLPSSFEDPAQFIEWSHGENQVRFIRRFEELEVRPLLSNEANWVNKIGTKNLSNWLIDSEFAFPEETDESRMEPPPPPPVDSLGHNGLYGARRPVRGSGDGDLALNVDAMSPKQFKRYLKKMRHLRPAFQQFVANKGKSLYELSQDEFLEEHRSFIAKLTSDQFDRPESTSIRPRPHKLAALTYTHHTALHTHLYAKWQNGLVLHPEHVSSNSRQWSSDNQMETVSFAGITSIAPKKQLESAERQPLINFESTKAVDCTQLDRSVVQMRMKPHRFFLVEPPAVVGPLKQGLKGVKFDSEVEVNSAHLANAYSNPHLPGTVDYMLHDQPVTDKALLATPQQQQFMQYKPRPAETRSWLSTGQQDDKSTGVTRNVAGVNRVLTRLRTLSNVPPPKSEDDDPGL